MNTAELQEQKRLIIQKIELIEDERILKAISELLEKYNSGLPEEEWQKIEKDDEDYRNGMGKNYTWDEVKIEIYNRDLDISMEQYKNGNFKTQEQLNKEI